VYCITIGSEVNYRGGDVVGDEAKAACVREGGREGGWAEMWAGHVSRAYWRHPPNEIELGQVVRAAGLCEQAPIWPSNFKGPFAVGAIPLPCMALANRSTNSTIVSLSHFQACSRGSFESASP
jgi:hypothetical protein